MNVGEILSVLAQRAPLHTAQDWDNVGLLVGDKTAAVTTVLTCLDVTEAAIDEAKRVGAQLIVSHHPVLFHPIKNLLSDSVLYRLAAEGIAVISLHTNLDMAADGINDRLAVMLGLCEITATPDGLCRYGVLPCEQAPQALAEVAAKTLHTALRVREGNGFVKTVAVCGGAGGDLLLELQPIPDAVITGELKHHEWLAFPPTVTVIEAGHYATELCATTILKDWLITSAPQLTVYAFADIPPYQTITE